MAAEVTQWHLRQPVPTNPVVFFGKDACIGNVCVERLLFVLLRVKSGAAAAQM